MFTPTCPLGYTKKQRPRFWFWTWLPIFPSSTPCQRQPSWPRLSSPVSSVPLIYSILQYLFYCSPLIFNPLWKPWLWRLHTNEKFKVVFDSTPLSPKEIISAVNTPLHRYSPGFAPLLPSVLLIRFFTRFYHSKDHGSAFESGGKFCRPAAQDIIPTPST